MTTNQERRNVITGLFRDAMAAPHDRLSAVEAADTLSAITRNATAYSNAHFNPDLTRRYALMAVGWLAIHGWTFPYGAPPVWHDGGCIIMPSDLAADDLADFLFVRDQTP